ncbi:MAG: hypothetical protein RL136_400 [Planctomycetota bacterium]|jgi:hypothetical protein
MSSTLRLPSLALAALVAAASCAMSHARGDDTVDTAKVERVEEIAIGRDPDAGERVVADAAVGSIELRVDPSVRSPRIEAEFTVDGRDAKDLERRQQLVRLYASRAADQSIVVQPIFPGKKMDRDDVVIRIIVPKSADTSLRTAQGTLTVTGTTGKLRLNAKSGAIRVEGHKGALDATAGDGAITLAGIDGTVRASATAGEISLTLAEGTDFPFELESRNGAIRVEVGAEFDGAVRMHTTGGRIEVSDPGDRSRTPQSGDFTRTVEIGSAGGQSDIRTTTGAIRLSIRRK